MKHIKKTLAMLLALFMIFSNAPMSVLASEIGFDTNTVADENLDEATAGVSEGDKTKAASVDNSIGEIEDSVVEEEPADDDSADEKLAGTAYQVQALAQIEMVSITKNQNVTLDEDTFYKIFHLDCGRKYFTVDQIKAIIDTMADNDYNYLELAIGNDGLRFLLDDMTVEASGITYSDDDVTAGIQAGNKAYYDEGTNELTEKEMDSIISYATEKGISIIPLINSPGHMDAILTAMSKLGISNPGYSTSTRTIDVTNAEAVNFTLTLVDKYIKYFADKGCKVFNLGADEYANDITGNPQFSQMTTAQYTAFATYVNNMAAQIQNAGMAAMAFNDGIYYGSKTTNVAFDTNIAIAYWSSGWSGYDVASASSLVTKGFKIVNTNGSWYYVLNAANGTSWDTAKSRLSSVAYNEVQGNTSAMDVSGAMICYWCDEPKYEYSSTEADHVQEMITTFAAANPDVFTLDNNTEEPTDTPDDGNYEERSITVTVGGKNTDTISGANYAGTYSTEDQSTATVDVTGTDEELSSIIYTKVTSNPTYQSLVTSNGTVATDYYYEVGGRYYQLYATRTDGYSIIRKRYNYSLGYYSDGSSSLIEVDSKNSILSTDSTRVSGTLYTQSTSDGTPASTTVTFNGLSVGTTYVTIGKVHYTINVIDEDLSNVNRTIEFWITNQQVTASGATSMSLNAQTSTIYSENGAAIEDVVPAEGTHGTDKMVYWKAVRLASDNKQTTDSGADKTLAGTDFTRIRYYNGSWAYYDGTNWIDVASGDQLVAYYLQETEVTDEVTTQVVDWGPVKANWSDLNYLGTKYVLMDYSVKYESGEEVPSSFTNAKTLAFHCDTSTTNNGVYYRTIGMTRAVETSDYEVYMITATPTSDSTADKLASAAASNGTISYAGTEKVVWAETQADLDNSGLGTWTSISGAFTYSIGGEPIVPGMEIYRQQGMKITYYVRAKVTEDSLTVNYVNETTGESFYNYNIAVVSGTTFDENISLDEPWKAELKNGSVENSLGNTQTVSADLSTMPAIGVSYRYSDYTCTKVERSTDGKTVTLYYTFNNTHSFVVDFGLPLTISTSDLNISGNWTKATVTNVTYGTATASIGSGITYIPNTTLKGIEQLSLNLSDGTNSTTHIIYIYPATTVYYEEGFAEYTGSWTSTGSKGTETQTTSAVKSEKASSAAVYGYDKKYADEQTGASNGTQAVSTEMGDAGEFVFAGTGIDIYANTSTKTGKLNIRIYGSDGKIKKMATIDTVQKNGSSADTENQEVSAYNEPVYSITGLDNDIYTVKLTHTKGTSDESVLPVNIDGFRVYGTLPANTTAYVNDLEDNPSFIELRNEVLAAFNADTTGKKNQVYGGDDSTVAIVTENTSNIASDVQDLLENGPKNELYLQPEQVLVFSVNTDRQVEIGLKAVNANTSYSINDGANTTITSSTDMFYSISSGKVTIKNTGNGILGITKLKICDEVTLNVLSDDDIDAAIAALNSDNIDEPEIAYADATLNISVVDYTGAELISTSLVANGIEGEENVFAAADIAEAAKSILPVGYAMADETAVTDQSVVYGEDVNVTVQAGKVATLNITYKKLFGKSVGTTVLTKVQTSNNTKATFSASEIRAAVPEGYTAMSLIGISVKYGSESSKIVYVY